jgi:hypothetical protein
MSPDQPPHDEPVLVPVPVTEGIDADDDLFDDGWQAPKRASRLTVALVVALLVVGGFAGGVLVQKHHDSGLLATGPTAAGRRAGGGPGGGGQPTARPSAGGTTDEAAGSPVVVGTVRTVDNDAIEVTDRSGAIVRVFVPRTAQVTTLGLGGLAYGTPVSVMGTKAVDGSVTATSVTATGG